MVEIESIRSVIEQMDRRASVESVYGEPIEVGDKTIVPVAKIGYGFGGGYGSSDEDEGGSGGGGGGGISATPLGALELTEDNTRFVRLESRKRLLLAFIAGIIISRLWGRRA
ncbi:GerW family sporulation protein [Haladaptatus halobius]|uniref:GerW family sporulation protein n=1 Tax=Haladaptatus halobius TaxID=2884875 RepID=UPI001D0B5A7D|nr:spore germination protein GerW family protein [Haladaptatus halobius]